jgi:Flp pilus assembly pilin Flp
MTPCTLRDDRGQGLAEYAVILGFVAVLCIGAVVFFGQQLLAHYQNVSTSYP